MMSISKTKIKLTNYMTGEVRNVETTQAQLMVVLAKDPSITMFNADMEMAFLAFDPSAVAHDGRKLFADTMDFVSEWHVERSSDEGAESEQNPIEGPLAEGESLMP